MSEIKVTQPKGEFLLALERNHKQIRGARAKVIHEDAETDYRRTIEDLNRKLTRLTRDQENQLDMSPDNAMSLKLATNFDSAQFVKADLGLDVEIYNTEIKLQRGVKRYKTLFGKDLIF